MSSPLTDLSSAPLFLEDSTMREGEQSPGVSFTAKQKVMIAEALQEFGVAACEVGTPAMGGPEAEAIKALTEADLDIKLIGWNRGVKADLQASFDIGLDAVHIGLPASDKHLVDKFGRSRDWVIGVMQELVAFAKDQDAWVSVSAEDSGRADVEFLVEYATAVRDAGADRMRVSDTVGILDPVRAGDLFSTLTMEVPGLDLQAHMHNDYGLATANTFAAVRAGARHVHGTINGLGDRCGIAPLEELVMGLRDHLGIDLGLKTEMLRGLCESVAEMSGRPIPVNKAIVGDAIFQHESGIHVDGMLKDAESFEAFDPARVGHRREIVIGKHSGTRAIQFVLEQKGIPVADRAELEPALAQIRADAVRLGRSLTDDEVVDVYKTLLA